MLLSIKNGNKPIPSAEKINMENFINLLSNLLKDPSFWLVAVSSLIVSIGIFKFRQIYTGGSITIENRGRQRNFADMKNALQPEDEEFYKELNSRKRKISPGANLLLFIDSIGLYLWVFPAIPAFFMKQAIQSANLGQSWQIGPLLNILPFFFIMLLIPLIALIFRWSRKRNLLHGGIFALAELKAIKETVERRSSSSSHGSSYTTFWKGEFELTDHKGNKRNFFVKRQYDFMEKLIDDGWEWLIFRPESAKTLFSKEPASRSIMDEPLFLDELNIKLLFSLKNGFSAEELSLPLALTALKALFILSSFFNTSVFAIFCANVFLLRTYNSMRINGIRRKISQSTLFTKE